MTTEPPTSANLVDVRGAALTAGDSRERHRQVLARITLDSMVQFVGLLDAHGTVLEINRVALDAVGITLSEVEGKPFWTTFWWQVSEEIRATLRAAIERAARGEFVRWDTEIYGRAGGSETIVIDASLCPVRDEHGNVVYITAEGRDITEKKAQEREIARQREELARLDVLKTQFFANVSHEFRTPLTLMLGPLEDALADIVEPLGARQRERIAMIQRNGLRLHKLVNALLDFSRVEAGRIRAVYQPTDLAALTRDLASSFRSACEKAGLALTIDTPPLPERVFVDHEMWEKIVLNLVSNAFKFTLEGRVGVALSAEGGHAVLRVADTGTGIPAPEVPRIFERFHRVEGARGRTHEGTGIGLALVRELIALHGGTVSVESVMDKGTTFVVRVPFGHTHLPYGRTEAGSTQVSTATRAEAFVSEALRWLPDGVVAGGPDAGREMPPASANARVTDRPRVLLADDNADMREYLMRLLEPGYEVSAAADGDVALADARRVHPDLILTDVMMPGLDGFGLLRKLRADPSLREVPVVVLSARAGDDAKVEGLEMGADDYLVKPFSARELLARVAANIEISRSRSKTALVLHEEAQILELLNKVGTAVAAELDLDRAVQVVTDAATELTGAAFGSFFYNVLDEVGESYMLYTLSGVPRDAFSRFPMPRNTAVFAPTFNGEGIVRSDDILKDPRYGRNEPHHGMPKGHLPVRSYLAAPVVSRSGEVLGGLFFGHPEPGIFTDRAERLLVGIAAQAAIAIDNARLYQAAQKEIAERTQTEAALRESEERHARLNQSLERMVAERTASLATANRKLLAEAEEREKMEHALRQSQKMEAVGKLTGGIAHDFNNLLQVVAGNLQLLMKDVGGNERAGQHLRNALAGVARGSKLASQLLSFGRRQPLAPKIVNLGRFVRGMDDMLRRALGEGIEVETVTSAGLWNTLVDTSQVENAILNLAINARDAMNGHGKLTIEAGNAALTDDYAAGHVGSEPGQYVMLAVTDTGAGIAPEILEHVFEPFFTTKPEGQGTGLGLSMVYGFVKQSNGHIRIYSEPGLGTTVRIYLPRAHQAEDLATETDAGPVIGGTETILVVEDDEDVRNTVVELLSDLGYGILKAKDAQSALAIVESGAPIDLLFTDVVMPGPLASPELARKTRERLPDVAVLFTSGYTDNAIVHAGRLDPGIELLSKPYTREALARKIRHVMKSRSQADAAKRSEAAVERATADPDAPKHPMTILLVEDESLIRLATAELLGELGHTVVQAANGHEALALLRTSAVDVLMADLGLPDMHGHHLAVEARQRLPRLPVIFATGNADPFDKGADRIAHAITLRKPYDLASLTDALETARKSIPQPPGA